MQDSVDTDLAVERVVMRKIFINVVSILMLSITIGVIDRSNVGFAKLDMISALGMTEVSFGFAASLFYLAFLGCEFPSTVAARRYGARKWICRIMLSWGVTTVATAFCVSPTMYAVLSLLSGAAEAGIYPVCVFYLLSWTPSAYRARAVGLLNIGTAAGMVLGSLISGALLDLHGFLGFGGWQWIFFVTGLIPRVFFPIILILLPDSIAQSRFLSPKEKDWLTARIEPPVAHHEAQPVLSAFTNRTVLAFAGIYICNATAALGMTYWLPTVIHGFDVSGSMNGFLVALVWFATALSLLIFPRLIKSRRAASRAMIVFSLTGAACLALSLAVESNTAQYVLLLLGVPSSSLNLACFWTLPDRFIRNVPQVAYIGAITAIGNSGGFLSQNIMPRLQHMSVSVVVPLLLPVGCLLLVAVAGYLLQRALRDEPQSDRHLAAE